MGKRFYEYHHIVSFAETNLVGNVYYVNHIKWQGECREFFLREYAPEILGELTRSLSLVTVRVSCEYFQEVEAFDEIIIRMYAETLTRNRIVMRFDYLCPARSGENLIARGEQEIACMRKVDDGLTPTPVPKALQKALEAFLQWDRE